MALHVVVHHRRDQDQPWQNAWHDDNLLSAIQTTNEIGHLCQHARDNQERVLVHRCAWSGSLPTICCSVLVDRVDEIDRRTSLVVFRDAASLNLPPPIEPNRGQNFYHQGQQYVENEEGTPNQAL